MVCHVDPDVRKSISHQKKDRYLKLKRKIRKPGAKLFHRNAVSSLIHPRTRMMVKTRRKEKLDDGTDKKKGEIYFANFANADIF